MKMKLIVTLLVLCLVFSTGSALANNDKTGSMDQSMTNMDKMTSMDKMASSSDKAVVVFAGNVTGSVTHSVNEMNGMAGNMSAGGKNKTRNINGNLLVVKDIEKNTENIILIGKMDGMAKPVTIIGRLDHMDKMTGNTDGMDGYLDNEKVIVTGDINCDMAGKMVIIGKMKDMKEMSGMTGYKAEAAEYKEKGKAAVAGYKATTAGCMSEDNMTGNMDEDNMTGNMDEDNMAGNMDEDNMAGDMDKNVTVSAIIRCNVAGKLVIIGKMGDIKGTIGKEEMTGTDEYKSGAAGYSDEEMKGMAVGKAGAMKFSKDNMKGMAAGRAGAMKFSKDNMTGMAAGRAGAIGVSTDNMKGIAASKAGVVGYSGENKKGLVAGKAGMLAYKNADVTVLMAGIVKCKMTGINMAVLGNMDKMTGDQAGMAEEECGTMADTNQSGMSSSQSQMCGKEQAQAGMTGEESGMMTENMESSTTAKGC